MYLLRRILICESFSVELKIQSILCLLSIYEHVLFPVNCMRIINELIGCVLAHTLSPPFPSLANTLFVYYIYIYFFVCFSNILDNLFNFLLALYHTNIVKFDQDSTCCTIEYQNIFRKLCAFNLQ